jgi:hypothetical protein
LDEKENELDHCMAQAIEVSPVGIRIETFHPIESEMIRLESVDSDGALIDIKGRVIHSRQTEDGRYVIGVGFVGDEVENTRFALKLIAACHQAEPAFIMVKGSENKDKERRKYPRVDTDNLVCYSCIDDDKNELDHCMARALDVNPLGAKIETYQEMATENILLTSVDVDGNLIDIMGKVVHCRKTNDDRYEIGIRFLGSHTENTDFALKLIGVCHKVGPGFVMVKSERF